MFKFRQLPYAPIFKTPGQESFLELTRPKSKVPQLKDQITRIPVPAAPVDLGGWYCPGPDALSQRQ